MTCSNSIPVTPAAPMARDPYRLTKADFAVPLGLILLSLVPALGGVARLMNLAGHTRMSADDARFLQAPIPVVIHVLSATLFCIVGGFQFSRGFRLRWPRWHRRAGRVLACCGLLAGASGLWMTALYDIPSAMQGPLLFAVRLVVATAMIGAIVIAWRMILRRDVQSHEAFMIRAYALGQGAGTQVLVLMPWMLISGRSGGLTRDMLMTLSWVINVVLAEALLRRRRKALTRTAKGEARRSISLVASSPNVP